jgi:hypothetical protein
MVLPICSLISSNASQPVVTSSSYNKTALMPAKAKGKSAAAKKAADAVLAKKNQSHTLSAMAGPFRNLMKYRMSDKCKKAAYGRIVMEAVLYYMRSSYMWCQESSYM